MNFINFTEKLKNCDGKVLVPLIRFHGENLVGVELGVSRGESFIYILQSCPNIKTFHGVDFWQPYEDLMGFDDDDQDHLVINAIDAEYNESLSRLLLKHSGCGDRGILHKKTTDQFLMEVDDESLDFIFLDAFITNNQFEKEIYDWFPKLKHGGIFSGHDWNFPAVQKVVHDFRKNKGITQEMLVTNNTWIFYK